MKIVAKPGKISGGDSVLVFVAVQNYQYFFQRKTY
jgi:hypothetical protein